MKDESVCADCGERVPIGGWPFCKSARNPAGHAWGTYAWKMKMSMKTEGWSRRER